jgi:hypothetical protein
MSLGELGAEVLRLERENEYLRFNLLALQRLVDSLALTVPLCFLLSDTDVQHAQPVWSSPSPACMETCPADRAATLALDAVSRVSISVPEQSGLFRD